jgi:hypothetical protein
MLELVPETRTTQTALQEARAVPVPQPTGPGEAAQPQDAPQPAPVPVRGTRDRQVSPILAQVAKLLRSPQAAGAAFVLREILDQPKCKRRQQH